MAEKEYIERGAVLKSLREYYGCSAECDADCPVTECGEGRIVMNLPAADVVEVRHGEWIPSPDGIHPIKCRNCGTVAPYRREVEFTHDIGLYPYKSNYCPNCGAKMDGGKYERN